MTDWMLKAKAFLYTPPDAVLIPEDELEARRRELFRVAFPDDPGIPAELAQAARIASALERPSGLDRSSVDFAQSPRIKHPLSGEERKLWAPEKGAVRKGAREAVNAAVGRLRERYPHDRPFFQALWRVLPGELKAREAIEWDLMPAGPCLPDSIWGYASATSAIASALPNPSFLTFTIASVQDYVVTARRTQDMWIGSFLFSYLTWAAIKAVVRNYGPDAIIYPGLRQQPLVDLWLGEQGLEVDSPPDEELKIASFPNFITALLPQGEAEAAAEEATKTVRARCEEIFGAVREHLERSALSVHVQSRELRDRIQNLVRDKDWKEIWDRQRRKFLDVNLYWVICPWGKDPDDVLDLVREYSPPEDVELMRLERVYEEAGQTQKHIGLAYPLLSSRVGALLTARKNLRHFRQSEEPGQKCSLCGRGEALHPSWWKEVHNHYGELRQFWEALSTVGGDGRGKLAGRVRPGDRLCAVCAVKRLALEAHLADPQVLGFDHHMFPSTSTVATSSFQRGIVEKADHPLLSAALSNYVAEMQGPLSEIPYPSSSLPRLWALANERPDVPALRGFLETDGDWLFEESFDEEAVKREYGQEGEVDQERLDGAREALKELLRIAGDELGIERPNSYYAVISMDGDRRGDWVTGRRNLKFSTLLHPDAQGADEVRDFVRPMGPGMQAALRTAWANFALRVVHRVVEREHCGKLIYAGGDDLLAFAPLQDMQGILQGLRREFRRNFLETQDGAVLLPGTRATISAGVAIAHRTQPLSQVVEESRRALEVHAKEMLGRDAFAFHLMKRSGEAMEVGLCWEFKDHDRPMETLSRLVRWFEKEWLSPRLARDMAYEAEALGRIESASAKEARLMWLVRRHIKREAPEEEAETIVESLGDLLHGCEEFVVAREGEEHPEEDFSGWTLTRDFILLANFIAKEP